MIQIDTPCPFQRLPPPWQEHTNEVPLHPKVFQPARGPDSDCQRVVPPGQKSGEEMGTVSELTPHF